MDTNALTSLMGAAWLDLNGEPFSTIDRFLTLSYEIYEGRQSLADQITWSDLNSNHIQEEFGRNCSLASDMLERLEHRDGSLEDTASFSGIQAFLSNAEFQNFCRRSLTELQEKVRQMLNEKPEETRSIEARRMEAEQESYEDIQEALKQSKQYAEAANTLRKKMAQLKIETVNAQHAAEGIIPNMLTTLGVFIAIVVAVVGCYLSLIFNKHQNPDFPTLNLSVCMLMGHILLNVIFLLMYLISKLTNYTLACHCHFSRQMDCGSCPNAFRQHCRLPNRIWLRYPYVVLLNLVFFSAYFILGLWYFFCSYLGCRIDQFFLNHHFRVFSAMFLMAALFVGFLFAALVLMSRNSKLKAAAAAEPNGGSSTEEDLELRRQISALSDRVEMVEALYEGRKDAAVKP